MAIAFKRTHCVLVELRGDVLELESIYKALRPEMLIRILQLATDHAMLLVTPDGERKILEHMGAIPKREGG